MRKRKNTDKKFGKSIKTFFSDIKKSFRRENYNAFTIPEVILLLIISCVFGVVMGCILTYSKSFDMVNVTKDEAELLAAYEKIRDNYYEDLSEDNLVGSAIDGMINSLEDPYRMIYYKL